MSSNFIVVIPARAGSKRIPKKNIYPLLGKPLLNYILEKIEFLEWKKMTYVSSDSYEIGKFAIDKNILFHKRPEKYSLDNSSTESVILNILDTFHSEKLPKFVITLPPTSPLLQSSSIINALEHFEKNFENYDSLISVTKTKMDVWHYKNNQFKRLFPDAPRSQQEREPLFEENSAIYITKTQALIQSNSILGEKVLPFEISQKEAIDINTIDDIKLAEFFLRKDY